MKIRNMRLTLSFILVAFVRLIKRSRLIFNFVTLINLRVFVLVRRLTNKRWLPGDSFVVLRFRSLAFQRPRFRAGGRTGVTGKAEGR